MALEFPILSLNPSAFSFEPKNKSLVPSDKYSILNGSCREIYEGEAYTYSIAYTNLSSTEFYRIMIFFNIVSTILPFKYVFEKTVYNVLFTSPIQINREIYNRYSISFTLETYFASIENWTSLETNLLKSWTTYPADPFNSITTSGPIIINAETLSTYAYIRSNVFTLVSGSQYILTVKPVLEYGLLPNIFTWLIRYVDLQPALNIYMEYTISNNLASYVYINNYQQSTPSKWSLEISLKVV